MISVPMAVRIGVYVQKFELNEAEGCPRAIHKMVAVTTPTTRQPRERGSPGWCNAAIASGATSKMGLKSFELLPMATSAKSGQHKATTPIMIGRERR